VTDSPPIPRILGRVSGDPGPLAVVLCAVHGNEPAGVVAARRVLASLRAQPEDLHGDVVAVVANRGALAAGRRFLAEDLNRGWSDATLARVADPDRDRAPEDAERRELWATLQTLTEGRPSTFVDLHTMSGPGAPFVVISESEANRRLGAFVAAPSVLGLDARTDGALLHLLTAHGHRGIGVEGGSHGAPSSQLHLEAAVWSVLGALEMITLADFPAASPAVATLRASSSHLPAWVDIATQHLIAEGDGFEMEAGWASFDPVEIGATLAHDRRGTIVASRSGVLLLPNYEGIGDHGFFIADAP
jgi:succinylglutamate desuccinylase